MYAVTSQTGVVAFEANVVFDAEEVFDVDEAAVLAAVELELPTTAVFELLAAFAAGAVLVVLLQDESVKASVAPPNIDSKIFVGFKLVFSSIDVGKLQIIYCPRVQLYIENAAS